MSTREFLNTVKGELQLKTDEELAHSIGTSKASIDKWIQRNSIPDKWKYIVKEKLECTSKNIMSTSQTEDILQKHFVGEEIKCYLSQFDHQKDIEEIIHLLPYAPGIFLKKLKEKLKHFRELSDI